MRRLASIRRPSHVARDRWLVSYADFMTLLFAFFATMYAISSVDAQKLSRVASALQQVFDAQAPPPAVSPTAALASDSTVRQIEQALARELATELASERLQLFVDHRGVTLSIPEAGTFGVGRDELSPTAEALVAQVAEVLTGVSNAIRVEGHTDDVPIHNLRFQSNWDLSAARAARVVEILMAHGTAPDRLSATGYGEFHPRVPNVSAESRARNRRIDLVVLNPATSAAEEPKPASASESSASNAASALSTLSGSAPAETPSLGPNP